MLRIIFQSVAWGTDPIDDGIQINLLDKESNILAQVPFTGESVSGLIKEIAEKGSLTADQKRELAPLFMGGLVLPTDGDFKPGPQG
jgi:hypothetical protein